MTAHQATKERIMEAVLGARYQRIRPFDLERKMARDHSLALSTVKDALKELMSKGELVFTYRDPCSYVEIPVAQSGRAAANYELSLD